MSQIYLIHPDAGPANLFAGSEVDPSRPRPLSVRLLHSLKGSLPVAQARSLATVLTRYDDNRSPVRTVTDPRDIYLA